MVNHFHTCFIGALGCVSVSLLCLGLASPAQAEIHDLKIGILQELTGPVANLGATCGRGVEIAQKSFAPGNRIGVAQVKLIVADVHNDAKTAVTEFQRLVDIEGTQVVIPLRSLSAMPVSPLSVQKRIPLVGIVGASTFTSQNRFAVRVYANPEQESVFQTAIATRLGKKRAAIIAVEDEFALGLADGVEKGIESAGGEVVNKTTMLPGEADFSTVIANIRRRKPDIIYAYVLSKSGLFMRKLFEAQLRMPVITNYWIQSPDQVQVAGREALENVVFSEINSDKPVFKKAYQENFPGESYNPAAYLCYATMGTVLLAASQPGVFADDESLRNAIVGVQKVALLDGELTFKDREVQFDMVARTFRDGQVVPFEMK